MKLGELIKHRRKEIGLTQKELSDGICTQALISRVEKGDIVPKKDILDKLSKRLDLDEKELSQVTQKSKYNNEIIEIKKSIRKYLVKRDYETIELIFNHNESLIDNINDENDQAFFSWIRASLYDKLYNQTEKALELFNDIYLERINDDLTIEIFNAIGIIYYQSSEFDKALNNFQNGINMLNEMIDYKIQIKIMYNYALALEEKNKDREALEYVIKAIDILVKNDSLLILGDLHHTKGYLLRKMGHLEEAKKNNQLALSIFDIQNNDTFKTMTQLEIKEIDDELQESHSIDYMD